MSGPPHRIRRLILEVTHPDRGATWALQSDLARIHGESLQAVIDRCCTQVSNPRRIHRIESLEIDLGSLRLDHLEQDLIEKLEERLTEALAARIREEDQITSLVGEHPDTAPSLELVAFFAKTGNLPWWADASKPRVVDQTIGLLVQRAARPLVALVQALTAAPGELQRLVSHCEDRRLASLFELLTATSAPGLAGRSAEAERLLRVGGTFFSAARDRWRSAFWPAVLRTAIIGENAGAEPLEFWREVLSHAALALSITYTSLVTALWTDLKKERVEQPAPGRMERPSALDEVLRILVGELRGESATVSGLNASAAVRTTELSAERSPLPLAGEGQGEGWASTERERGVGRPDRPEQAGTPSAAHLSDLRAAFERLAAKMRNRPQLLTPASDELHQAMDGLLEALKEFAQHAGLPSPRAPETWSPSRGIEQSLEQLCQALLVSSPAQARGKALLADAAPEMEQAGDGLEVEEESPDPESPSDSVEEQQSEDELRPALHSVLEAFRELEQHASAPSPSAVEQSLEELRAALLVSSPAQAHGKALSAKTAPKINGAGEEFQQRLDELRAALLASSPAEDHDKALLADAAPEREQAGKEAEVAQEVSDPESLSGSQDEQWPAAELRQALHSVLEALRELAQHASLPNPSASETRDLWLRVLRPVLALRRPPPGPIAQSLEDLRQTVLVSSQADKAGEEFLVAQELPDLESPSGSVREQQQRADELRQALDAVLEALRELTPRAGLPNPSASEIRDLWLRFLRRILALRRLPPRAIEQSLQLLREWQPAPLSRNRDPRRNESASRSDRLAPRPTAVVKPPRINLAYSDTDEVYVENAGLAILWPFLGSFLERMDLVKDKRFKDPAASHRAARLLGYLVTEDPSPPEYQLTLPKVLCGLALTDVLEIGPPITETEAEECTGLLTAVIANASILKEMSPDGFRGSFLLRKGVLSAAHGTWLLRVERVSYDVVLDRFPWGLSWIKLPWMEAELCVEW